MLFGTNLLFTKIIHHYEEIKLKDIMLEGFYRNGQVHLLGYGLVHVWNKAIYGLFKLFAGYLRNKIKRLASYSNAIYRTVQISLGYQLVHTLFGTNGSIL